MEITGFFPRKPTIAGGFSCSSLGRIYGKVSQGRRYLWLRSDVEVNKPDVVVLIFGGQVNPNTTTTFWFHRKTAVIGKVTRGSRREVSMKKKTKLTQARLELVRQLRLTFWFHKTGVIGKVTRGSRRVVSKIRSDIGMNITNILVLTFGGQANPNTTSRSTFPR